MRMYFVAALAVIGLAFTTPAHAAFPFCKQIALLARAAYDDPEVGRWTSDDGSLSFELSDRQHLYEYRYAPQDGLTVTIRALPPNDQTSPSQVVDKNGDCIADTPNAGSQQQLDDALDLLERETDPVSRTRTVLR